MIFYVNAMHFALHILIYSTERIIYYHHASFSRSRFHEDKIIYDLFKNTTITSSPNEEALLPRGTYVELGAFDGKDGELYQYYIFDKHYFPLCIFAPLMSMYNV